MRERERAKARERGQIFAVFFCCCHRKYCYMVALVVVVVVVGVLYVW